MVYYFKNLKPDVKKLQQLKDLKAEKNGSDDNLSADEKDVEDQTDPERSEDNLSDDEKDNLSNDEKDEEDETQYKLEIAYHFIYWFINDYLIYDGNNCA